MKQFMKKSTTIRKRLNESKTMIVAVLFVFLVGTLMGMVSEAKGISEKFVRFHIVANSDFKDDQAVKMLVREAIFSELDFSHITSKDEAILYFTTHQDEVECIANRVLKENGFTYQAKVTVAKKEFPVREYSDFVLPAGYYDAVSVVLGEGSGENFFCVMYPSLCRIEGVTESTDSDYQVLNGVLTEEEVAAIAGNENQKKQIVYKFKIVEFLEHLF